MKLYLAGPEVFLPNAADVGARKKAICREHGFDGVYPVDDSASGEGPQAASRIFAANVALIRGCDLVIANLTPFRSVSADVGTAFEVGLAFALGKLIFGYSNEPRPLAGRVSPDGMAIEDFGGFDNLMLTEALVGFAAPSDERPRPIDDLTVFEVCAALAARTLRETDTLQRRMAL